MNIWLVQTGEPLPLEDNIKKMRTAVLADELIKRGHSILWWTSAFDHFKKDWIFDKDTEVEIKEGLKIFALKGWGYKRNVSFSRIIDHRIVTRKFRRIIPKITKPDIILTSMPPHDLAYEAVKFAKSNKIPILVDIRDPWPDIFLNHTPAILRIFAKMLLYNDFKMIKKTMQLADGLIAVTDTFLEWGLKYAERDKILNDNVFYLGGKKTASTYIRST